MRSGPIFGFRLDFSIPDPITYPMAKKLYIVETQQVITQTWEYEFETDEDLKTNQEVLDFIHNNGIEGNCMDDDEVIKEEVWDFKDHPVEEKA